MLFRTLKPLLRSNGEIHIFDSPFYHSKDIAKAKERSVQYYQENGFPEMAKLYFHHNQELLHKAKFMYKANKNKFKKLLGIAVNPFNWYCLHYTDL